MRFSQKDTILKLGLDFYKKRVYNTSHTAVVRAAVSYGHMFQVPDVSLVRLKGKPDHHDRVMLHGSQQ